MLPCTPKGIIDYLKLDDIVNALHHIKICCECAIESDNRPKVFKHTSLLFNHIEDDREQISYSGNTKTYGNEPEHAGNYLPCRYFAWI